MSVLTEPLHFSLQTHDEYMSVLEGRVEFMLDGNKILLQAGDPELFFPRRHVHSFKFFKGEPAVLKERTSAGAGSLKEDFFENLLDNDSLNFWATIRACYDGDAYLSLPGGFNLVDQVFVRVVGGFGKFMWPQKHPGMRLKNIRDLEGSGAQ